MKKFPATIKTAEVSINDVLAVAIGEYEGDLVKRRNALRVDIRDMKVELNALEKEIEKGEKITKTHLAFDITVSYKKTEISWDKNEVDTTLHLAVGDKYHTGYNDYMYFHDIHDIPNEIFLKGRELSETIRAKSEELKSVMIELGEVGIKEREIRAKLSKNLLDEAGLGDILETYGVAALLSN